MVGWNAKAQSAFDTPSYSSLFVLLKATVDTHSMVLFGL